MKIVFEDKSYIEVIKSASTPNKLFLSVAATSVDDKRKLIVNCVELTPEQLLALLKSAQ